MQKLDFFIAGVQKGGTTALDHMLRQHPSIQMASLKEVHHFDDETQSWTSPDHSRLHRHFDWSAPVDTIRGEATPIYTYWPQALERIQRYNASAKIVVCLRHPTFRAFSHWRMETKRGAENLSFPDAISELGRKRVHAAPGGVHRVFSYVERGYYSDQVERVMRLFPCKQVFFIRTDCLWGALLENLALIQAFLDVEIKLSSSRQYIVMVDASELGRIPQEAREFLDRKYEQDIRETARQTGLDLSDWLDPSYRERMSRDC